LDWSLIGATVYIESGFNPTQKSPCGARGICQLLEGTCLAQCKKLGIPYEPGVTVWRDIDNLLLGVSYLKEAAKISEDTKQIASHYCGGPAWQKSNNQEYIMEYGSSIVEEQAKLKLIYDGLQKK
jgi:soluble lytic murein transglycosylase-like protein